MVLAADSTHPGWRFCWWYCGGSWGYLQESDDSVGPCYSGWPQGQYRTGEDLGGQVCRGLGVGFEGTRDGAKNWGQEKSENQEQKS